MSPSTRIAGAAEEALRAGISEFGYRRFEAEDRRVAALRDALRAQRAAVADLFKALGGWNAGS